MKNTAASLKIIASGIFLTLIFNSLYSQILDGNFYVPSYPVPDIYNSENEPELPDMVLNYKLPYFPQQFYDQGTVPSCGQASAIYYCLTYEFNRLMNTQADSSSTFAPLYTYFFLNYGNNYYGVSSFDSWNIVKSQGNPFIKDFPEINFTNDNNEIDKLPIWMNGYDKYYRTMKNRISGYYSLDASTDQELKILQHYLHDHLRQEQTGGTAIIYANPKVMCWSNDTILSANRHVTVMNDIDTTHEPNSHSMAIVGYYQNTRYDFNEDGIISDSIDTNGDGIVDFRDNEKILWVMANSSDTSPDIFLFKYSLLANCFAGQVFIPVPDTAYMPELTAKIRLKHPIRGLIKLSMGISENITSNVPEHTIDFPIFNFQGGILPMQGDDTLPNSETIEIGLDISPLMQFIRNDGTAKIFLNIDNASHIDGSLEYFSVFCNDMDTSTEHVAIANDTLIPAKHTSRYYLTQPLKSRFNDSILLIESDSLYTFINGENHQVLISATGGTPPYKFYKYRENEYIQQLSTVPSDDNPGDNSSLLPDSILNVVWPVNFAEETFDTVIITKNGYIIFRSEEPSVAERYPYEYFSDIPLNDMEIKQFYPDSRSHTRRINLTDSCINIQHYGARHFSKTIIKTNGIIQFENHPAPIDDWYHSSYLRTHCFTYYSELLPLAYQSPYNSVIYYPVPDTSQIYIDESGIINLNNNLPAGDYQIYVLVIDSKGERSVKQIPVKIIENSVEEIHEPDLLVIYPNPVSDEFTIELKNIKNDKVLIEIANSLGETEFAETFHISQGENTIRLSVKKLGLSDGVYIGKILDGSKSNWFRFVVM